VDWIDDWSFIWDVEFVNIFFVFLLNCKIFKILQKYGNNQKGLEEIG
jgi:hypothetical protein